MKIGATQAREATGWETWSPSSEDLQLLKQAENNLSQGLWSDETEQAPEDDEMMLAAEADIFQFQPPKFARTIEPQPASQTPQHTPQFPEPIHRPFNMTDLPRTIGSLPTQEQTDALQDMHTTTNQPHAHNLYQHEQHQQQLNQQTLQQQQNIQYIHIDQLNSPTYQNFGPQAAFGMNAPTTKSTRARSRTPSRAAAPETPQL